MEEIRCPACKKNNPPEEENCLFCGADLIPPAINTSESNADFDPDVPSWLKELRESSSVISKKPGDFSPDENQATENNETEENIPEWLRRIRAQNAQRNLSNTGIGDNKEEGTHSSGSTQIPMDSSQPSNPFDQDKPKKPSTLEGWLDQLHKLENPKEEPKGDEPYESLDLSTIEDEPRNADTGQNNAESRIPLDPSEAEMAKQLMSSTESKALTIVEGQTSREIFEAAPDFEQEKKIEQSLMADSDEYHSESAGDDSEPPVLVSGGGKVEASGSAFHALAGKLSFLGVLAAFLGRIIPDNFRKKEAKAQLIPDKSGDFSGTDGDTLPVMPDSDEFNEIADQQELRQAADLIEMNDNASSDSGGESKDIPGESTDGGTGEESGVRLQKNQVDGELPTEYIAPTLAPGRLHLTDQQRAHREMLEELLKEELQPVEPAIRSSRTSERLLRWLLSLLVIGVVFTTLAIVKTPVPSTTGQPIPTELVSYFESIETLPDNSVVLVAFDYNAGFSAEMSRIAQTTLEHLIQKNARIAAISIIPAGPVLADDLYRQVSGTVQPVGLQLQSASLQNDRFVNLGYMAGGLISLREFAFSPQTATMYGLQSALDRQPTWSNPIMRGIHDLSDFSLIIVITDTVETGKAWVEQVQPVLLNTPLLFAASAQAAPILNPYIRADQAQGMVSGFAGNTAYLHLLQKGGDVPNQMMAYRTGMYLLLVFLVIGLFLKAFNQFFSNQDTPLEKE